VGSASAAAEPIGDHNIEADGIDALPVAGLISAPHLDAVPDGFPPT
jgi:hypothetical protein